VSTWDINGEDEMGVRRTSYIKGGCCACEGDFLAMRELPVHGGELPVHLLVMIGV
jgi:hypothetical protein